MTTTRIERKLGRAILRTIADIELCPPDSIKQFLVLKRRLKRNVDAFKELTGRDILGEELLREIGQV